MSEANHQVRTYHLEEEVDPAEFCSPVTTQAIHMIAESSVVLRKDKIERVRVFHKAKPHEEVFLNCYRISPSQIGSSGVGCCMFRGVSVWREATRQPQATNWLWASEDMCTALIYGYVQVYRIVESFCIIAMDDPANIRQLRALYARDLEAAEEDRTIVLRDLSRFDLAYRVAPRPHPPAPAVARTDAASGDGHPATGGAVCEEEEVVVRSSELENDRIIAEWLLDRCSARILLR